MDEIDGPSLGEIFKPVAWETTRIEGRQGATSWSCAVHGSP